MKPALLLILFSTSILTAQAQQGDPVKTTDGPGVNTQQSQGPEPTVPVYHDDNSIKPPDLLPADFSPLLSKDCKNEAEGIASLSIIIDSNGKTKSIKSLDPLADDLDRMAIAIVKAERFSPAIKDGSPIAAMRELRVYLALCLAKVVDTNGKPVKSLRLTSLPVQKLLPGPESPAETTTLTDDEEVLSPEKPRLSQVGAGVSPPVPILTPAPNLTPEDRKIKFSGSCIVSVMVDNEGIPHHVRIVRAINPALDQKAAEAVANYRFKPAMAGKRPVPVMMAIQVNFRLY